MTDEQCEAGGCVHKPIKGYIYCPCCFHEEGTSCRDKARLEGEKEGRRKAIEEIIDKLEEDICPIWSTCDIVDFLNGMRKEATK